MERLVLKLSAIFQRGGSIIWLFPKRFIRIFKHLKYGVEQYSKGLTFRRFSFWFIELSMLILDALGIGEIYEIFQEIFKWNVRPLNSAEKRLAQQYFGNQLNINRIRVDEAAFIGPKQGRFAYVSFYTINSWNALRPDIFLHELVHIWQYEKYGITYMSRALLAQKGKRKYNYGGLDMLKKLMTRNWKFKNFNPEHQAEIVQDHFRIKNNLPPIWGNANINDLEVYEKYVEMLKKVRQPSPS